MADLQERPEIDFAREAFELKHALAANAYPAADGGTDIDNDAIPIIETTLRALVSTASSAKDTQLALQAGDIERLRRALIAAGRAVGGGLADTVSTDFLMHVPREVAGALEAAQAEIAGYREALEPEIDLQILAELRYSLLNKWTDVANEISAMENGTIPRDDVQIRWKREEAEELGARHYNLDLAIAVLHKARTLDKVA